MLFFFSRKARRFLPHVPLDLFRRSFADGGRTAVKVVTSRRFLSLVRCYILWKCYAEAQVVRDRFLIPVVERIFHAKLSW